VEQNKMNPNTYEFTLTRNNHTFKFKILNKLDQYQQLQILYKVDNMEKFGQTEFAANDYKNGVIYFYALKLDGKKVDGIRINDKEIEAKIEAIKTKLLQEHEQATADFKQRLLNNEKVLTVKTVGCDWPHLAVYPREEWTQKLGYSVAFQTLEEVAGFKIMDTPPNVSDEQEAIGLMDLAGDKIKEIAERKEKRERKKQAQEDYLQATGKTLVYVNECWECGCWRILGGKNGRLPYNVFTQARKELSAAQEKAYNEQSNNGELVLSRINIGSEAPEGFALVTDHFAYIIVSNDYDGC
jgi:hypothetical protein